MLIRHLASENPPTELVLRLQHAWKLGKPSQPDQFFAFGTLWTDAEGIRIQGDSHRNFAAVLMKRISIGSYYKISGFTIRLPRPDYRTCQFPHWLSITPGTRFELQPLPDPAFTSELFELVSFSQFPSRMPPCPYLTDFVGKLIKIGSPNHVEQNSTVAPVQNVTVADESGLEVDVSLWSELSTIIDPQTVILDDLVHPAVVLFSGFKIGKFRDRVTAYSGSASRVIQEPYHPAADALRAAFADSQCSIVYVEPKFPTLKKLKNHVKDSYRTVQELLAIYVAGGESEPRYRCTAKITGFDRQQYWCYTACPHCSCTVVANGHDFWCKNHDTVLASDVAYRYRLKLFVADQTNSTVFVLLGLAADRLLPITATELARAYPSDYGEMPPPLQLLVGQHVTFEVHLPRNLRGNTCDDFVVTKMWGLQASRAHLLSQLPIPVPPMRSPSPPSRHNTPIPPDPRYVPPVMINLAASTETPQPPADTLRHLRYFGIMCIRPLRYFAFKISSMPLCFYVAAKKMLVLHLYLP
ncbi:Replication protein A 70 kDa DNA-binding subunit B [Linum grandiflorum]